METWVEEIEGWDTRPHSGGYAGLRELAADEFSGAVSKGGTWLFMVNGRVVDVVEYRRTHEGTDVTDGDIERFADGASPADGTVYVAPHPSVPLLVAMKVGDGETRGKYYTEKTSLAEVSDTLSDGNFTGYVELSENVLSGDYYAVYQSGRSMNLAFIGNARRLVTEEDARERMDEEVGIYEVIAVDVDVVDIPEPEADGSASDGDDATGVGGAAGAAGASGAAGGVGGETAAGAGGATGADDAGDSAADEPSTSLAANGTDGASADSSEAAPPETDTSAAAGDGEASPAAAESTAGADGDTADDGRPADDEPTNVGPADAEPTDEGSAASDESAGDATSASAAADDRAQTPSRAPEPSQESVPDRTAEANSAAAAGGESATDRLATRAVPSLDPERTETADGEPSASGDSRSARRADSSGQRDPEPTPDRAPERDSTPAADPEELQALQAELREAKRELESTRRERDELASKVETLRSRIRELEAADESADAGDSGPSLAASEAYAGTNLFVRYGSKGELTLEDARDGHGDPEALASNLRLEHHTRFDEAATVDGRPFAEWLATTQRHRFAEWLATTLPFEIRDTGAADQLGELYDALPELDRIELDGTVTVEDEEGERDLEFGLVGRDRMGEPLVVADLESGKAPVSEGAMGNLVTEASAVAETHESLAGAFYVTSAFYEPDALETAREATSGSLLSRDKRRSFVKLSRKRGYHLVLAESREKSFNLSVPDL